MTTKRHFLLSTILILILILSTACASKENPEKTPKETQPAVQEEYGDTSLGISAKADKELQNYESYLIMGTDLGKRSDILLIVSINKETGESTMTTIDRDTYMQVKGGEIVTVDGQEYEFCKCNRAYQKGGLRGATKEMNSHLDLNIRKAIAINWEGVANLIDSIGGIDVYVEENMLSWINSNNDLKELVQNDEQKIDHAGQQNLNGWQAVQYLRARKYYGGNARKRAERNEDVFNQILNKTSKLSEDEIMEIYLKLTESLDTDMNFNELFNLLETLRASAPQDTDVWPYSYETKWDNNYHFYYQVPLTLESNVKDLHKTLFNQENYEISDECQALNKKIEELSETELVYNE